VPRRVDKETENSFFTERFGGFQPMSALPLKADILRCSEERRCSIASLAATGGTVSPSCSFVGGD